MKAGRSFLTKNMRLPEHMPEWRLGPWLTRLLVAVGIVLCAMVVFTPFELYAQLGFAFTTFLAAYVINRFTTGRLATLILIGISIVTSLRYLYWRLTSTLGFETNVDALFGYGLLAAELYTILVLLLSYFQSAWPLKRKPVPLPDDVDLWPSVDIFIPTYNEPLDVVSQTALTALAHDWPAHRFNIYVLDDGNRPEFKAFCEQAGVGYITRDNNRHAKAGNINEALKVTNGEYVAIFDCDHVPTRSFLQIVMGWFLLDPKLAMLQTPHVFFSPDPLEQNLEVFKKVPNEGKLFYGLTQDGNDLWNATFFCGSCAVLRRSALLDVGGVAVESVTEDALTALKMNRKGYNTAYLAIPLAAGLATESLSRHVGQRIRWARGMAQIFRSHNPLIGKGLSLAQRLCYASAALHFFYGLPRLVFLTAPLAYLFFGAHVFNASALLIMAYAVPHIVHALLTNSRMQGKYRHTFWNEVYETVLAWYIMLPTLATLVSPNKARFNVTQKGGVIEQDYFDWELSRPYIALLSLNIIGFIVGFVSLVFYADSWALMWTLIMNLGWTLHNIVISSASLAVAGERKQIRQAPRVVSNLVATIQTQGGYRFACETTDFSQFGLGVRTTGQLPLRVGEQVWVSVFRNEEEAMFPARVVFVGDNKLGMQFDELSIAQQAELAKVTFARADTWALFWADGEKDSAWVAMKSIGHISLQGFKVLGREANQFVRSRFARLFASTTK
ncbi:UDP-forming cellulose synthase catalytic subunit [Alcaligenes endophyticus]